jgi:hypothetical protein
MIVVRSLVALVVILSSVAACSQAATPSQSPAASSLQPSPAATAPPSAVPSPSAAGTPAPSASADDKAMVLTSDGIGPYAVGAELSTLEAQGLVANLTPSFNCDDTWQHGDATGTYAGAITLTFEDGTLIDLHTDSPTVVTSDGARVGMQLTELQAVYGSRGTLITGASGNQALSVRAADTTRGTVFYLDSTNTNVLGISAGGVERLEQSAVVGEGC